MERPNEGRLGRPLVTAKSLHLYATADVLDYLAVRVDGPRAATADLSIGVELSDTARSWICTWPRGSEHDSARRAGRRFSAFNHAPGA